MRPARATGVLAALVASVLGATPAFAAWTTPPRARVLTIDDVLPASGAEVDALRAAKRSIASGDPRGKVESAVQDRALLLARAADPRRGSLVADFVAAFDTPIVPVDESGRLLVRIDGANADARASELATLGVETVATAPGFGFLEAWVPADRVAQVAALGWVRLVAAPGRPVAEQGLRLTEGDAIHRADQARTTFAIDGTGARVGVISDGVVNALAAQGSGDLPAVQVGLTGSGDEGTAMLEIVHDLAPGAALAFHAAGAGSAGMITAQNWLVGTALAKIVSDDIWLPREPYFEDGPVALNAAAKVTANDVVYFTSAGNRAQRHIPQAFVDGGARNLGVLGASRPHVFGGADVTADIRLRNPNGTGVRHTIVLQWGERFGQAARDLDLYLVDPTFANVIALSTNLQNGTQDPVELIDFTYNGPDNVPARLVVDYAGALPAPAGLAIKIAANGPTFLEYGNPAGSINPHARHPLVYALGAIDQADPGNDTMEGFSSRGPADLQFPAPAFTRPKPDASAIDGVTVTGAGGFPTPFFGTSAASPHAAGIAALLRGVLPALTSAEVRDVLTTTAIDIGPAGFDPASGAGRLDAFGALASQLNEPPVADAGNDTTAECSGPTGTPVRLDGTRSFDPDGDAITFAWAAPGIVFDDATSATPTGSFPLGTTLVTLTVSDGVEEDTDEALVTIEDTTPPVVTVTLDPDALWPPNHKLAPIQATVLVEDVCDAAPTIRLVSIDSDEPDDGLGDGDRPDDIQGEALGTADFEFLLRSERQGPEDGRIYTVCYEAEDASGNVGTGCATVVVTHDREGAASFVVAAPGADPATEGGWLEVTATDGALLALVLGDVPEYGGDAFARVAALAEPDGDPRRMLEEGGGAPTSTVRFYLPGETIRRVLQGATTPVVYARFVLPEGSLVVAATLPLEPGALATIAGAAAAEPGVEDTRFSTGAAASAPAPAVAEGAPDRLLLAAANPLPRGGTLRFGVPAAGRARVTLVAANGRRVATLADGEHGAGWHAVRVPAELSPGAYFAVAERAGERAVQRIVVLR